MKTGQNKDADSTGVLSLHKDKTNPPCPPFRGKGGYDGEGVVGMVRYLYNEGAFSHYQRLYYLYDTLGSVAQVTAENGLPLQDYLYTPYGEAYNTEYDSVNGLRFVGRYGGYTDDDTRLTYFWHRWYDSADGRWVSRDPIGVAGGVNLYGYVGNRTKYYIDAVGYCPGGEKYQDRPIPVEKTDTPSNTPSPGVKGNEVNITSPNNKKCKTICKINKDKLIGCMLQKVVSDDIIRCYQASVGVGIAAGAKYKSKNVAIGVSVVGIVTCIGGMAYMNCLSESKECKTYE